MRLYAISPEQSPFHALHSLRNVFSVATCLDVQPHDRLGVRATQIEAPYAHVEAQPVHFVDGYCFGFKCSSNSLDGGFGIVEREIDLT